MANINELGLTNEKIDVSYDEVPEQFGGGTFTPPPYPGTYRFKLPPDLSDIWETFQAKVPTSDSRQTRVRAVFDPDHPIKIQQSMNGGVDNDGQELSWISVSGAERNRGKDGPAIADLYYLIRSLGGTEQPTSNMGFVNALSKHGGEEFVADVEWNAYCNPNKSIWFEDENGALVQDEVTMGCATSYYQRDLDKVDGVFQDRKRCQCDASLIVRPNLTRFKPIPK